MFTWSSTLNLSYMQITKCRKCVNCPYIYRTKHVAGGNLHTSMSGSCGVCVDGVLYLFGGHHARGNTNRVKLVCDVKQIPSCLFSFDCITRAEQTLRNVRVQFVLNVLWELLFSVAALQIYRLPLRAPSLVWEEMRDLKGLPPSSKDKLGCWVQKNRWEMNMSLKWNVDIIISKYQLFA